jgi:hypothetical protein
MSSNIGMTFIYGINLLWPIVRGAFDENTLQTTNPIHISRMFSTMDSCYKQY